MTGDEWGEEMNYEKYLSEDKITVTNREFYTDSSGYQNEKAFWDFVKDLKEEDELYLLCLDLDLTLSNQKSIGFGDLIMRTFFTQIRESFPIFRMKGTKFNVFVPKSELSLAQELLDSDNKKYFDLHGEIIKDKFVTSDNIKELVEIGMNRLYKIRKDKQMVVGQKGNTPVEGQETPTKKFIAEMWFATIEFEETAPNVRKLTAYIFPTEYKPPMALLHTIVVIDDKVQARVYEGMAVQIPIDGMKISITTRFDHDGHLVVSWFRTPDNTCGIIEGIMEVHEGTCIPASFGKRIGNAKEIFPVKENSQGLYEYVLVDKSSSKKVKTNNTTTYVTSGIVKGKENIYEVHKDSVAIVLAKAQNNLTKLYK